MPCPDIPCLAVSFCYLYIINYLYSIKYIKFFKYPSCCYPPVCNWVLYQEPHYTEGLYKSFGQKSERRMKVCERSDTWGFTSLYVQTFKCIQTFLILKILEQKTNNREK
ncbi:hypothetical protein ATANTOWER_019057 [Ataeniobius toweri]|uniref:Uncharacterized protein n=1 Tax=Ataeniobius toweri TaxID=208326 RepID=A0ABU7AR16_9TELE|nr:hypothetical protein [Ataeniobius toweri]